MYKKGGKTGAIAASRSDVFSQARALAMPVHEYLFESMCAVRPGIAIIH
jgi:hypothetical protein